MGNEIQSDITLRYEKVPKKKATGATFTPKILADFVASKIMEKVTKLPIDRPLRVLDPSIGHGELLISMMEQLAGKSKVGVAIYGFETDPESVDIAYNRLEKQFPDAHIRFSQENFLEYVLRNLEHGRLIRNPEKSLPDFFDLIVANPPYVRTQIMGAVQSQYLSNQFGLSGRIDLYHAFILGISEVLGAKGTAGLIVSNRFMTTRSGAPIRRALSHRFKIRHAWDLGDTKLFNAAVLPAVLLVEGKDNQEPVIPTLTTIYETTCTDCIKASDPISALKHEGMVAVQDGRFFQVKHGQLTTSGVSDGVWRIANDTVDSWLARVKDHTWGTFLDIGKIRVGVKTCADKIFIRNDWESSGDPELVRRLTTHHNANRFRAKDLKHPASIIYPHEVIDGRRQAVDLKGYPRSRIYFEKYRQALEGRRYVIEAGRMWYEIWVPQDPDAWNQPKLVFRDISAEPTFWVDLSGSVVNGDCYWLTAQNSSQTELLWLAVAVGNSTFIEKYYDVCFNNRLYAGRRRYMTQYVERFPLPDPKSGIGKAIIEFAQKIYNTNSLPENVNLQEEVNMMVWESLTGSVPD